MSIEAIYWIVFYTITGIFALYHIYLELLSKNKYGNINKNASGIYAVPKNIQPRDKAIISGISNDNIGHDSNHDASYKNAKDSKPFHWRVVYNKLKKVVNRNRVEPPEESAKRKSEN